jgi:hypothetical protein
MWTKKASFRYRVEQASQTEKDIEQIKGERILNLYEKPITKQKIFSIPWYGKVPTHRLIVWLAFAFAFLWLVSTPALLLLLFLIYLLG